MPIFVSSGRAGDGRADAFFDETVDAGPTSGLWHVVRTRPRLDALRDRAVRRHGAFCGDSLLSFEDLIARLASRRTEPRRRLEDAARLLVIDEIVRSESRPPLLRTPAVVRLVADFFRILKSGGAFSRKGAEERFPSLLRTPAAAAALDLLDAYTERLKRDRLYDGDGLAVEAARDLGGFELPADRAFAVRRRIVVEGLLRTSPVERAVLERLFAIFEESVVVIDLEDPDDLSRPGAAVFDDVVVGSERLLGEVAWLRGLGAECGRAAPSAAPAASIERFTAADLDAEVAFVASRIAAIRADDPGASILVATPSDRTEAPRLAAACAADGTPLSIGAAEPLGDTTVARAFLALMSLPERDFPREAVVAALRGAARGFRSEARSGEQRLFAAEVDRVACDALIFSGRDSWIRRLEQRAALLAAPAEAADEDAHALGRREAEAAAVARVGEGVAALFALLPAAAAAMSVAEFVERATALATRTGMLDPAVVLPAAFDAATMRAAAMRARSARGVVDLLTAYARAAPALDPSPRPWSEHVAALRAVAGQAVVSPPPAAADAPRLVGLRDVRGLAADYVVVFGVHDRSWPEAVAAPPFLSEADATRAGARTGEARRREAEHLLLSAKQAARKTAIFVRPLRIENGEAAPSDAADRVFSVEDPPEVPAPISFPLVGRSSFAVRAVLSSRSDASVDSERSTVALDAAWTAAADAGVDVARLVERLEAVASRRSARTSGRHEGLLEPAALPLLARVFDARTTRWSASRLEDYLACPLRFFFKRVLRATVGDEPDQDVTRLESGDVLHRTLRRFLAEPAPDFETPSAAARRLSSIAAAETAESQGTGFFARAFVARLTRGLADPLRGTGPLREFLVRHSDRRSEFRPTALEASFGLRPAAASSGVSLTTEPVRLTEPAPVDGRAPRSLLLTGSIDRIDIASPAVAGGPPRFVVVDYKSGKTKFQVAAARRLRAVQLPLYAAVAERLSDVLGHPGAATVGATYWSLSAAQPGPATGVLEAAVARAFDDGLKIVRTTNVLPEGGMRRWTEAALARALDAAELVANGSFHPHRTVDDSNDPCAYCDYRRGCSGRGAAERLSAVDDPRFLAIETELFPSEKAATDDAEPDADEVSS